MSELNAEFPSSFELWEFVLSFEDGSMPASAWDERALAVVAIWYLFLLPPIDAMKRLELGLRRNQLRFGHRVGAAGDGIDAVAEVWPRIMRQLVAALGEGDPVSAANRLMGPRADTFAVADVRQDSAA